MIAREPLLRVDRVVKEFPIRSSPVSRQHLALRAVDRITLDIYPGETLGLVGETGCGKSTLARALVDLLLEQGERTVTSLDGDVVRRELSAGPTPRTQDRGLNHPRVRPGGGPDPRAQGLAAWRPHAPEPPTRARAPPGARARRRSGDRRPGRRAGWRAAARRPTPSPFTGQPSATRHPKHRGKSGGGRAHPPAEGALRLALL